MRIQLYNMDPAGVRDTKFERILAHFDARGEKKCVTSPVIATSTKPLELAQMLREFARAIEDTVHPRSNAEIDKPVSWLDFLEAVHRTDRFIEHNVVWRTDFSARPEPPTCPPTFEFQGWRVYKPR